MQLFRTQRHMEVSMQNTRNKSHATVQPLPKVLSTVRKRNVRGNFTFLCSSAQFGQGLSVLCHSLRPTSEYNTGRTIAQTGKSGTAQYDFNLLHFSYGANLSSRTLNRRGVVPKRKYCAVLLGKTACMEFRHRGGKKKSIHSNTLNRIVHALPSFACINVCKESKKTMRSFGITGYATLNLDCPQEDKQDVHGVVYELSHSDLRKLKHAESGYSLVEIEVSILIMVLSYLLVLLP
mmetsp:Transcript_40937/g.97289  ORF Transcript_40937/g.97289 Transcript_40937/m.97289 type:complete len:235 (+) Transcript_40937:136-840(+)